MITIDPTAKISPLADIEASVRGTAMVIGPDVVVDAFVKIKPAGGSGDLYIGPSCFINSGTVIYTGNGVWLEANVLVAANCTLAATDHEFADRSRLIREQGFRPSRGGIAIEDDVWVGAGSVILDGTRIGRGCVIAAGSVVKGELAPYGVYAGALALRIAERG